MPALLLHAVELLYKHISLNHLRLAGNDMWLYECTHIQINLYVYSKTYTDRQTARQTGLLRCCITNLGFNSRFADYWLQMSNCQACLARMFNTYMASYMHALPHASVHVDAASAVRHIFITSTCALLFCCFVDVCVTVVEMQLAALLRL